MLSVEHNGGAVGQLNFAARLMFDPLQAFGPVQFCVDAREGGNRLANIKARIAALTAAALIIAAGATWYVASPGWTLNQMKAAADADDSDALNTYIDYPALREDLKAETMAQMIAEANKDKSGFGRLGLAIGTAMVGPVIDGLVTPAGMRVALMAKRDEGQTKVAPQAASALRVPFGAASLSSSLPASVSLKADSSSNGMGFRGS